MASREGWGSSCMVDDAAHSSPSLPVELIAQHTVSHQGQENREKNWVGKAPSALSCSLFRSKAHDSETTDDTTD